LRYLSIIVRHRQVPNNVQVRVFMKIQGPSSLKSQPTQSSKKSKVDGSFHTFLEAEIAGVGKKDSPVSNNERQGSGRSQAEIVEEAAQLLDKALKQLAAGEKPAEQVISSIQQLRTQLQQQPGETTEALHQADTMLAVEAERIHSLNH